MMSREGLKALAAKKQRVVELGGASFTIKKVDFQEAVESLGEYVQQALLSYFFKSQADDPGQRAEAEKLLAGDRNLQKAMMSFRRSVLTLGMIDPILTNPGEREDLDPEAGPAKVSMGTLDKIADDLQGEILGGDSGEAEHSDRHSMQSASHIILTPLLSWLDQQQTWDF